MPDTALDPRFAGYPAVTAEPPIRFYAAAPSVTREGHAIGTLCVMDHLAGEDLTAFQGHG